MRERAVGAHLRRRTHHLAVCLRRMACCRTSDRPDRSLRLQKRRRRTRVTKRNETPAASAAALRKRPSRDLFWPTSSKPAESRGLLQRQTLGPLRTLGVARLPKSRRGYQYPSRILLVREQPQGHRRRRQQLAVSRPPDGAPLAIASQRPPFIPMESMLVETNPACGAKSPRVESRLRKQR